MITPMSRDEAALYGTPQARARDAIAKGDAAEAIELMEWMAADWERQRAATQEGCLNAIAALKQAIAILKGDLP